MFFLAFLPQFVRPDNGYVSLQPLILGVLFVVMGLLGTVVVGIYCALGVRLALQEK